MSARSGVVTLLTDFGHKDPYVGIMKGVILGLAPEVRIVDLTHDIDPQDVTEANFALQGSFPYFPKGTVHVVVVDPGVGSRRRIVCAEAHGSYFIAPDNGVLTDIFTADDVVRGVTEESLFRGGELSQTFHGRDIFAPVAAHLARGVDFARVGSPIDGMMRLDHPLAVVHQDGTIGGNVVHVDRFGNLITNVRGEALLALPEERRHVRMYGVEVGPPVTSYGAVSPGSPLAIVDSFGFLEIAVNGGSAEKHFNALRGDSVRVG